ncbi:MvdC/MvdD family ATP grasp protein [Nonomuraea sp. NPDC026600]|uniref:MvdC/MvdD family ATP grasp protein n=1 Tax=Nonomuraea sp. NPDC026600 TaxID=3155363 RepID=UPI0033D4F586
MHAIPYAVLVVTSLDDATANMVIEALNERKVQVLRIDPVDIGTGVTVSALIDSKRASWSGWLRTPSRDVPLDEIAAAYYRRPTSLRSDATQDQARRFILTEARFGLGGLLRTLPNCRYVNHPSATERADYKVTQLQVATQVGMKIPSTLVTNDLPSARDFSLKHGRTIYKSFRGAPAVDGQASQIWTQRISPDDLDGTVSMTSHMFQEEIQKTSDARVTVVGRQVFASRITTSDRSLDWRSGDWGQLVHDTIEVPEAIRKSLFAYLDHFGLTFGCFDFTLESGEAKSSEVWTFVECNPNGQWGWLPNSEAIADAFADVLLEGWWP